MEKADIFTLLATSTIACGDVAWNENLEQTPVDPRIAHSAKVAEKSRECIQGYASCYNACIDAQAACGRSGNRDNCSVQYNSCYRPVSDALDRCLDELGNKHDPLGNADYDMDGLSAFQEFGVGTDPCNPMSDGKTPDGERDHDNDGIPNKDDPVLQSKAYSL